MSYNINLLNYHDNNTSRCTIKISRADIYRGLDLIKLIGEASEKIDPPRIYFLCEAYSKTHLTRIVMDIWLFSVHQKIILKKLLSWDLKTLIFLWFQQNCSIFQFSRLKNYFWNIFLKSIKNIYKIYLKMIQTWRQKKLEHFDENNALFFWQITMMYVPYVIYIQWGVGSP